jgi:hypothetical protein
MEYVIAVIAAVLVVLVVIVVTGLLYSRNRRRTKDLREQFGAEYDRTVEDLGDKKRAEQELEQRKLRVEGYALRPLSTTERNEFIDAWKRTESRFVDEPSQALNQADHLVLQAIKARGYELDDGPGHVDADLSVRHPGTVGSYRFARATVVGNERGEANTEALREAMMHFRRIFEDVIADEPTEEETEQHRVSA